MEVQRIGSGSGSETVPEAERAQRIGTVSVAELFQGFSKVSGLAMPNTAVMGTSTTTGTSSSVNYTVCKGQQELMNAIGLEQSLGISSSTGNISVDQRLEFVNSLQVSINTVSILIRAMKRMGRSTATSTALTSGVTAPSTDVELQRFFSSFGDCFVSELEQGGEYIATYTFYSQSREQQNTVSSSIQAQGMGLWGSVDSSLAVKVDNVVKVTSVRVEFNQHISGIQHPSLPNEDNCIDFALGFPSIPLDAPIIISFNTSGYEVVPEMTETEFRRIAVNRELLAGGFPNDRNSFRGLFLRVRDVNNAIAQIKQIHNFYGINTEQLDSVLASMERQADADERLMQAVSQSYFDDPLARFTTPSVNELQSLRRGTPVVSIRTTVVGQVFGAPGETAFDDVGDPRAFVQQFSRITSIAMKSGWFIDNLGVTYTSGRDRIHGTTTVNHGRPNHGNEHPILTVPRGHHITSMSTAYWERGVPPLEGLQLKLSDGRSVRGGSFNTGTLQHTYDTPPANSFMLGFQGRKGWFLDQLQLIYGTFSASTWEL